MPGVSVIIPAYNSGHYLDEAVQSVIAQTFADWECIVVDDGSTEDLSRVEKMDPRIRLIRQPNRGTSAARNMGILNSVGEFIAFLDHDDIWFPRKLERQLAAFAEHPEAGLCHAAVEGIDADGNVVSPPVIGNFPRWEEMLGNGAPQLSTTMIRRETIAAAGLFDPLYPVVQDMDLFLRIARIFPIISVPSCELQYRWHGNNTSARHPTMYLETASVVMKYAALARRQPSPAAWRAVRAGWRMAGGQAYEASRGALRRREIAPFLRHIFFAVRCAPAQTTIALMKYPFQRARRFARGVWR